MDVLFSSPAVLPLALSACRRINSTASAVGSSSEAPWARSMVRSKSRRSNAMEIAPSTIAGTPASSIFPIVRPHSSYAKSKAKRPVYVSDGCERWSFPVRLQSLSRHQRWTQESRSLSSRLTASPSKSACPALKPSR